MTMRAKLIGMVLVAVGFTGLTGCTYENNYYGDFDAGGVAADGSEDNVASIFFDEDKVFGSALLGLDQPAVSLINVRTKDHTPHVLTVSLGAMIANYIDPGKTGFDDFEVVAKITLSIGGIPYLCEVDFIQGQQFSVAASQLMVDGVYRRTTYPGVPLAGTLATYNAGASVASGVIAHGNPPQRTISRRSFDLAHPVLAAGASIQLEIPAFAKSMMVLGDPQNAQLRIQYQNLFQGVMTEMPVVGFPSARSDVPNGARYVNVTNMDAVNAVYAVYLIFSLSL